MDASEILRDVLESSKEVQGADHPATLIFMSNLALCYDDMGEKDQAVQLMTKVLDKRKEVLRADHPCTIESARTLADWKREKEKSVREQFAQGQLSPPTGPQDARSNRLV